MRTQVPSTPASTILWISLSITVLLTGCTVTFDAGAVLAPEHISGRSGLDLEARTGFAIADRPMGAGLLIGGRLRAARDWLQLALSLTALGRTVLLTPEVLLLDIRGGLALGTDDIDDVAESRTSVSPYAEIALLWQPDGAALGTHLSLTIATEWVGRIDPRDECTDEGLVSIRVGVQHAFWPF